VSALDNSDAGYRRIKAANWSIVKLMDSPARAKVDDRQPERGRHRQPWDAPGGPHSDP
jgi:hypothetical protein